MLLMERGVTGAAFRETAWTASSKMSLFLLCLTRLETENVVDSLTVDYHSYTLLSDS